MATPTHFKLSKQGGLTRRLAFTTRPSWVILSLKIGTMYEIEPNNVGVSYIDQDGDQVTLSSEEELQDYYNTLGAFCNNAIKLMVQDLSSLGSTYFPPPCPNPITPPQSHFRNTFGHPESPPFVFEVDDEWQRLPASMGSLFEYSDAPESPHAFVEVIESDISVSKKPDIADKESLVGDITQSDATFNLSTVRSNKGKSRTEMKPTVEDDVSSTDSVFGDDTAQKPKLHVYGLGLSDEASTFNVKAKSPVSVSRTAPLAQAHSTPVMSGQFLPEAPVNTTEDSNATIVDDPPQISSVDNSTDRRTGAPSLANDVAAFLTTASGIISSHPELSEGIRNIVTNVTNGTYWATHCEAFSRAAANIQEETGTTVEEIRRAEEEIRLRAADAIGGVFHALGEAVQTANISTESFRPHARQDAPTARRHGPDFQSVPPFRPFDFPTHVGPPQHSHFPHHARHQWGPPPFPPGGRHGWPRPPPPFWGAPAESQEEHRANTTRTRMSDIRTTLAEARNRRLGNLGQTSPVNVMPTVRNVPVAPPVPAGPVVPPSPPIMQGGFSASSPFRTIPPPQEELRADVERAKADYKMRKERYRQAKAIRKMAEQREQGRQASIGSINVSGDSEFLCMAEPSVGGAETCGTQVASDEAATFEQALEHSLPSSAAAVPPQPATPSGSQVHIVSNARGSYPQLEMFSVPRRSQTIGHSQRRGFGLHGMHETRSMQRIMTKLSEMGFTESTYPKLSIKVTEQVLVNAPTTKDAEDDIVTNLIEELISSNSAEARAGGSKDGIPGGWP